MDSMTVEHDDALGIKLITMTSDVAGKEQIHGHIATNATISLAGDISVSCSLTRDICLKPAGLSTITEYLNTVKNNYRAFNANLKEKKKTILHQIHLMKSSTESLKLEAEAIKVLISEMLTDITLIHEELAETKHDIQRTNTKKGDIIGEFKRQQKGTEQECQVIGRSSWTLNLRCFASMLGLDISHEGDLVIVTFNRLSQGKSEKDGCIALKLVGDRLQGISCMPFLQQFEALTCHLNEGLAFGRFLCLVRSGFKELI